MSNESNSGAKNYYLSIWKGILLEFLGWSENQVIDWVARSGKMEYLNNPNDIFYHQTPQYWVANALIPDTLRMRLSETDLLQLRQEIFLAFNDDNHYAFSIDTDWSLYKSKVNHILNKYGEYLS
jgi:hypothetical protein